MNSLLHEFPWPARPGDAVAPRWEANQFLVGARAEQVLCYHATGGNWTTELTALHEAEAGGHHPIDAASRALAVDSARRFCPRAGSVVLEVGCSSGFLLEALRRDLPAAAAVIGSDFILPPLEKLARRLPGVPLLQFDLRQCPLPDGCVDAVIALNVLEHIDDDERALRQMFRILRRGGVAHVEVPAGPRLYDIYDEHLLHHRRYTLEELRDKAGRAGFQCVRATHLGALLYPAFWFVKRRNRKLLSLPPEEKKRLVAQQIRRTSGSALLRLALRLELFAGRRVRYPAGIRCVIVLHKPEN